MNSINFLKRKFKISVGFSDHSDSTVAPMIAVLKGAEVIEKHITLSNKSNGPDHKASLNIKNFKKMLDLIKFAQESGGDQKKTIKLSEKKNIYYVKKSLVAKKEIKKGEKFNFNNLTAMRPQKGIPLNKLLIMIGKKSKKNYKKNQII